MVEYDPFGEQVKDDPYPVYGRLRDESPVHFVEKYDCYAITRFEDVWNLSMDPRFSTAKGTTPGQLLTKVQPVTPMLNVTDPPDHTRLRQALRRFFMPGKVGKLEPVIREVARQSIAVAREKGELDICVDFASPVAVKTTCTVVGFPFEDADLLKGLVDRFFGREPGVDGMTDDGLAAAMEINEYFVQLVQKRRAAGQREDDAVDVFMNAEVGGERLTDEALGSHLSMLLIGGSETFPKVFANLMKRLAENPEARAACAADPSLIPDAFTEGLRIDMPTQFLGRTLVADVELHGVTMREGQAALFVYPAANRDDREFADPDSFDIRRRPERILSFGSGTHACVGMHVAKLEGRICTEELLSAWPEYEVDLDRSDRLRTEFVQGYMSMPIRF